MDEEQRGKLFLERLLRHQEEVRAKKFYAINRIDLMLISVSGAGLYIIFEMIKFFRPKGDAPDLCLIKIAGCLFVVTVVINIISQWSGYYANKYESDKVEIQIDKEKGDEQDEFELGTIKKKVELFNKITSCLNIAATIMMFIGILILTIFNLFVI